MKIYKEKSKGFTLIETFVAITILLIAVLGPMSLFARAIRDGIYAKNQITAFYLAQEGLELAVNYKDSNVAAGFPWLSGLSGLPDCSRPDSCIIEFSNDGRIRASSISDLEEAVLNQDANGIYSYDVGGTPSLFKRTIQIVPFQDVDGNQFEARILVSVVWNDRPDLANLVSTERKTVLETIIYNIQS